MWKKILFVKVLEGGINKQDVLTGPWQVVSEVLFPTTGSSPAQSTPVLPGSPPGTPTAPPQSSVPPCDAQISMGVISQLLQEAEGELTAAKCASLLPCG